MKALISLVVMTAAMPLLANPEPRLAAPLAGLQIAGVMRNGDSQLVTRFAVVVLKGVVTWTFMDPVETFGVDTNTVPHFFFTSPGKKLLKVPYERYAERVRDTELIHEDLTFGFLSWPDPQFLGVEGRDNKFRFTAPDETSHYGTVDLWINEEAQFPTRAVCWDREGNQVKILRVKSVHGEGKGRTPKQIDIVSFASGSRNVAGRTYVTLGPPTPWGRVLMGAPSAPVSSTGALEKQPSVLQNLPAGTRDKPIAVSSPEFATATELTTDNDQVFKPANVLAQPYESGPQTIAPYASPTLDSQTVSSYRPDPWTKVVATLERQSGILIAVVSVMIGLIICAASFAGWVRGTAER